MSLIVYAACTISSIPDDKRSAVCYFEKSVVELHDASNDNYFLRAIDLNNKKEEIFNIQLTGRNLYKLGYTRTLPDEVRSADTTYCLLLKLEARDVFHEALNSCFHKLDSKEQGSSNVDPERSSSNKSPTVSSNSRITGVENEILTDIHTLSECIENGDGEKAKILASKLASQGVQVKGKILDQKQQDAQLQIRIKIDGTNLPSHIPTEERTLDIYRSTSIHDLRALFQHKHGFPLENQYFFVNGHLAHKDYRMIDLAVEQDALFILFVTGKR